MQKYVGPTADADHSALLHGRYILRLWAFMSLKRGQTNSSQLPSLLFILILRQSLLLHIFS